MYRWRSAVTKRKIKDIVDFGQGTVIELNKQAGAPVDIVVNGQLLARGDVVVIDDNFGVRITEIVGVKELMERHERRSTVIVFEQTDQQESRGVRTWRENYAGRRCRLLCA